MQIKQIIAILALAATTTGLAAQSVATALAGNVDELAVSYTAEAGITTKHVFRGLKRSSESLTAGLRAEFPDQHLYGGLYTVQPLSGADNSEFDAYFGIAEKFGNGWLSYDFGLNYYYYPNKLGGSIKWAFEPYFGLTAAIPQVEGLAFSAYLYYDLDRAAFTAEVAASYTRQITQKLSGRLSLFTGFVDGNDFTPEFSGPKLKDSYVYYGVSFDLPCQITDAWAFTLGFQCSDTSGIDTLEGGNAQFWGYGRLTYNF